MHAACSRQRKAGMVSEMAVLGVVKSSTTSLEEMEFCMNMIIPGKTLQVGKAFERELWALMTKSAHMDPACCL